MKILFINEYIGSPYHGMVYRHYYLAQELIKRGHEVYMVTSSFTHLLVNPPCIDKGATLHDIDGVKYIWIKMSRYAGARSPRRLLNMISFAFKALFLDIGKYVKPDVVIASSPSPFSIYPAVRYAAKYKSRLIYEVRDIWPLAVSEMYKGKKTGLLKSTALKVLTSVMGSAERKGLAVSDKVVSVFPAYWKHMQLKGFSADKFIYVPNGYSQEESEPPEEGLDYIEKSIRSDGFSICYCGTLGQANALWVIIEALRLMDNPDVHLYIAGEGVLKKDLMNISHGMENVVFLGHIPKNTVGLLLNRMDAVYVGLMRSRMFEYGISPTKLAEAMHSAKPVITSLEAPENPVEMSGCGICAEAESPQAVAEAVKLLMQKTEEERAEMGNRGVEYVKKHLLYSKLAERYEDLFTG